MAVKAPSSVGYHRGVLVRGLAVAAVFVPTLALAQPLIITAPAAPGGGWDQTARAMQRVLADVEPGVSVQVDNVPGAAGTIGLARFARSERGNPNALLVTGLVMVSGVITNGSPVSLADTTPIARLTGEYEVIVVPSASPHRSLVDLISAFRRDPGSIAWGGGSAGGTDDLLVRLLAERIGLPASRVNYIAFPGGGAALAAVLGGQVTAAVSGYSEFAGQIAAGQLRVLGVSSPARVAGIDAPTLHDSGISLDLANWRAVVAPPGLSDAEQASLTGRITRLAHSPEWRTALERNGWDDQFLAGGAFRQFLIAEQSRIEQVFRRLAAAETTTAAASVTVTPSTAPALVGLALIVAMALAGFRIAKVPPVFDRQGLRMCTAIGLALLMFPLAFATLGFVIAATMLFASVATVFRATTARPRTTVLDLLVGAAFVLLLFIAFTRGLGVILPGPAF